MGEWDVKAILLFAGLALLGAAAHSLPGEGTWTGTASLGGEQWPVRLELHQVGGTLQGRYSLPQLDLEDIPLDGLKLDDRTGTVNAGHAFSGRIDGGRLTGKLRPMVLHGVAVDVSLGRIAAPASDTDAVEQPVSFTSRGFTIKGTFVRPRDSGPHPALVSLHGSGPSTRWLALARARRFARAGFAMLIFDKPGSGESGGDWTMSSLDDMATDAIAAVDFVRNQPGIDRARVGVWGHSQAGWVIGRAAARPRNHIAFAIVLAGGGTPPREVEEYGYRTRLLHASATPDVAARAIQWADGLLDYEASGKGYDAVKQSLDAQPDVRAALQVSTVYPTPLQQPKWSWVATYKPWQDIRKIRIPVLLLFPGADEEGPSARSLALWRANLRKAGNRHVEWKLFNGADHHFFVYPANGGWPVLAPGFYETQTAWLDRFFRSGSRLSPS